MWLKRILVFVVVVFLIAVAYNLIAGGGRSSSSRSPEEQQLARLVDDFRRVQAKFREANSAAGLGGVDMTAEIDAAYNGTARIEAELTMLKSRLQSDSAKEKAEQLLQSIAAFKRSLK